MPNSMPSAREAQGALSKPQGRRDRAECRRTQGREAARAGPRERNGAKEAAHIGRAGSAFEEGGTCDRNEAGR